MAVALTAAAVVFRGASLQPGSIVPADPAPHAEAAVRAAPGLDYDSWNGAMLRGEHGTLWGVRVGFVADGQLVTGPAFANEVERAGAYAADGGYADLRAKAFDLGWARLENGRLAGRVTARRAVTVIVEAYPALLFNREPKPGSPAVVPYRPQGVRFSADPRSGLLRGEAPGVVTHPGSTRVTGGNAVFTDRMMETRKGAEEDRFALRVSAQTVCAYAGKIADDPSAMKVPDAARQTLAITERGELGPAADARIAYQAVTLRAGEELYLIAGTTDSVAGADWADVRRGFARVEAAYRREGLHGSGSLGRGAEAMIGELFWMTTWNPYEQCRFLPAGRSWMDDGRFNLWGWDENFNAMIAATVNRPVAERNVLLASGDERVGPLAWWMVYSRYRDKSFLAEGYAFYSRLIPADAALPRGMVGKGMDDTPMRELPRGLGKMTSLDLACMKAWSMEILARAAALLGHAKEASAYRTAHAGLLREIDRTFWNEEHGIYRNRYRSGEWPVTESPTSFYPWLAGAPDAAKSARLLVQLTDAKRFWGRYILPTLARDDPEYGQPSGLMPDGKHWPAFCYWRGAIWPPPNFLVYEGLKRNELDAEAAELAERSAELWWTSWSEHGESPENFDPETGRRTPMSSAHQSWSMLLPLIGVKELFDIEWWRDDLDAIRFGSWSNAANAIENVPFQGHLYAVHCGAGRTELWRDGSCLFRAEGGPVVVREFKLDRAGVSFCTHAPGAVTATFPAGPGMSVKIPAGRHRVRFVFAGKPIVEEVADPVSSYAK